MMIGRSRQLAEQLDAVLEGRLATVPDELAPLLAVADELRAELADIELDTASAEAHLNLVYRRGRAGRIRRPQFDLDWRRRAVSIALACSLVGLPAAVASGRSLPGDPLYALKLGIEKVRLVAAMSPGAEAGTRTSIATVRLEELEGLLQAGEFGRIPDALVALQQAVIDAQAAIAVARSQGADSTTMAALESRLAGLTHERDNTLNNLPAGTKKSVIDVLNNTTTTTVRSGGTLPPPPCTGGTRGGSSNHCPSGEVTTTTGGGTTTTSPPVTTQEPPPTTEEPPPPPTTQQPPTPTDPPVTTVGADDNGRGGVIDGVGDAIRGLLP
jgi:uncharacterized protein DUF5667